MIASILLYLLILIYFGSLYKIFEKAGREKKWEGFVPGYNLYIWLKIMKKPWWWLILMIVPGVNFLMIFILNVELARTFNLRSFSDTLKMVLLPWYYVPYIAYSPDVKYVGPMEFATSKNPNGLRKTRSREWFDALLFAVIAATIIRTFFLEAFKIPTPSMEKNLLVGDFLFVSKVSYGAKLPETPISFPFTHNTLPFSTTKKSYLEIFTLPHLRLPGFGSVQRNDVVVFNFPAGDSVMLDNTNVTYYQLLSDMALERYFNAQKKQFDLTVDTLIMQSYFAEREKYIHQVRKTFQKNDKLLARPVDKRDNYIKRCVGIPGDVIEVRDGQLFVNNEMSGNTDSMQFNYIVHSDTPMPIGGWQPNDKRRYQFCRGFKDRYDINSGDIMIIDQHNIILPLTLEKKKIIEKKYGKENVRITNKEKGYYLDVREMAHPYEGIEYSEIRCLPIFPNDIQYNWTEDNFGPLKIPAKGETVQLNLQTLPVYRRIIDVYEHHDLEVKGNDIFIDGAKATSYTFAMNYYWLMGDNRQNSADSRFWGFVPDDHVVGKAVLIWFSTDPETGVRWSRIFKGIK